VENGEKLLNVEGCNIEWKVHTFEELVMLGKWFYKITSTTIECDKSILPLNVSYRIKAYYKCLLLLTAYLNEKKNLEL
jgi:hypothetical protein